MRDIKKVFQNNLAHLLKSNGINTQEKAAKYLGTTQAMVSRYLRGESEPPFSTLAEIAEKFGVSVSSLFDQETQPEPNVIRPTPLDALEIVRKALERTEGAERDQDRSFILQASAPGSRAELIARLADAIVGLADDQLEAVLLLAESSASDQADCEKQAK